jgi:hypothetical protein
VGRLDSSIAPLPQSSNPLLPYPLPSLPPPHSRTPPTPKPYRNPTGRPTIQNVAKGQLSVLLEELQGKAGKTVFYRSRSGLVIRLRAIPTQPNTPAQLNARAWLTQASRLYKSLPAQNVEAWETFAQNFMPECTANTAFVKLTAKWFQIQHFEAASPPSLRRGRGAGVRGYSSDDPPISDFRLSSSDSDATTDRNHNQSEVTDPSAHSPNQPNDPNGCSSNRGTEEPEIEKFSEPSLPPALTHSRTNALPHFSDPPLLPPTSNFPGDSCTVALSLVTFGIRVQAVPPNAAGIKTEVLLQELPGPNRKPRPTNYHTVAISSLSKNGLFLDLPTGVYAVAYRFVKPATGQSTLIVPIRTVIVPN